MSGVSHGYGGAPVLAEVDLAVSPGEHLAVTGPSGAGKSTLLALIGGLDRLQTGSVRVDGVELGDLDGRGLARYRSRTVGFVFQHFGLLDALTALENVELAMALAAAPAPARHARARELLAAVGLTEAADHRPGQLSGGERQRVAIARALANRPRLLLADEPTGNLDEDTAGRVLDLLGEVREEHPCTLLVVTHNPMVAGWADREVRLSRGRLTAVRSE